MARRTYLLAGLLVGVGIAGVTATAPSTRASAQPTGAPTDLAGPLASAWALELTEGPATEHLGLAQVSAQAVPTQGAWAAPMTVEGQIPVVAAASPSSPSATQSEIDWVDPTGSVTVRGGYADATVTPSSADARAGVGTGSGSSFAFASKYLTWSQQQELTTTLANLNQAIVPTLNARLSALAPVLALLGVSLPQIQQMSPVAAINVAGGDAVSSEATTAASPSYATAHAQSQIGTLQLFDGFITVSGVKSVADSQSAAGDASGTASAVLGQVQIAGIAVTADEHGITLAGNNPLARQTLQPVLDLLLSELASSGVTLEFDRTASVGGMEQATALELDVSSSAGLVQLSVGNAVAGSGPTSPEAAPVPAGFSGESAVPEETSPPEQPVAPVVPPGTGPAEASVLAPSGSAGPTSRGGIPAWLGVTLPAAAARALHGAFLLALGGGLGAALLPVVVIGSSRRRTSRHDAAPGKEVTS